MGLMRMFCSQGGMQRSQGFRCASPPACNLYAPAGLGVIKPIVRNSQGLRYAPPPAYILHAPTERNLLLHKDRIFLVIFLAVLLDFTAILPP